ncbi:DUF4245 family protein [Jatrophihabitans sp.]|uniref:DUF4245 family protein n=1 Tax=Jatrophihabitans sp. TaxID=1932789 RepID=UPI002B672A76|nr:DUF4245 family protein [Jatrophihabitans sp.]
MTRPPDPAARQRLRTPANLWRALIPLLVIVGLVVLLNRPAGQGSDGVHVIDPGPAIAAARQQSGFAVLVPTGLPAGWRPTSSELVPAEPAAPAGLRIGYVSPAGKYAELFESPDAPEAVAARYGPLTTDGTAPVAGASWQRYQTSAGRLLLRHTVGTVTAVVTGSASQAELVELAGSLR